MTRAQQLPERAARGFHAAEARNAASLTALIFCTRD